MSPVLLFSFVLIYFAGLLFVAWYTSRNSDNDSFFIGNRNSNWFLVALGMVGTSMTGVTFLSVPGTVGAVNFGYFQIVIGYWLGYFVVAFVLLPLYYKLHLTSIYDYLNRRFGMVAYKTGSLFFIISRTLGATARLYLVINVLQIFILDAMGVPFGITVSVTLLMILLYTFEGGVKTIVFTDTLQTVFMLTALIVCLIYVMKNLDLSFMQAFDSLSVRGYTRIFNGDVNSSTFWLKQIVGGAFITIAMTGLDQEMMQKNISVSKLKNSQKNIFTFSTIMVIVNLIFLFLGGLLYVMASTHGLDAKGDDLFPEVALHYLPAWVSIVFVIGIISTLFPSADGAITAITSSFCLDILGLKRKEGITEESMKKTRMAVHLSFTFIFLICIIVFKLIDNKSIIDVLLQLAGYTYGPLLGLFSFGILTKRNLPNGYGTLMVCLAAPVICYLIHLYGYMFLGQFQIGIEMLVLNGLITFTGLWLLSTRAKKQK
ncbi:MAG: sodium:solute symporter [Chitinophagaceae bacterium]|nr:sodium:solute symporter [Chitinophagaceae bacterium]